MTINTTANKTIIQGNGTTTQFTFNFIIPALANILVYYTDAGGNNTLLSQSVYSVSGLNNSAGGIVTYPLAGGTPIATGTTLTIVRIMPLVQSTEFAYQNTIYPQTIEGAFDYITEIAQQLYEQVSRSPALNITSQATVPALANPSPNQYLAYDSTGENIIPVSAAGGGGGGSGNVTGPLSSVAGNFASFDNITGTLLDDSGKSSSSFDAAGTATAAIATLLAQSNPFMQYVLLTALGTIASQNANAVALTGGTITGLPTPTNASDAATKAYVDNAVTGISEHANAVVVSTSNLSATYSNGTAGVGATLTNAGTQAALTIDSVALSTSQRVLVSGQTTAANNGIYTVTTIGSGSTNWVLTRATDYNSPTIIGTGGYLVVSSGTVNAGTLWFGSASGTVMVGTTAITFTKINVGAQTTTLTGDVTGSGAGTISSTIASGAVTLAKMASLAATSLIGNTSGSGATPAAIPFSRFAQAANNLSDLASASTARTNLGLGSAATFASTAFALAGSPPFLNLKTQFGAKGDGTTDDTAAIQAALTYIAGTGGCLYVPTGNYRMTAAVSAAWTNSTFTSTQRPAIFGDSSGLSVFMWDGSNTPSTYMMSLTTTLSNFSSICTIRGIGFSPISSSKLYYASGLYLSKFPWINLHDVNGHHLNIGAYLDQVISSNFFGCLWANNNYGLYSVGAPSSSNSAVYANNALAFFGCTIGGNNLGGASMTDTALQMFGGSIEDNGQGNSGSAGYGVYINNTGGAAAFTALFSGVYIEANGTTGDAGSNATNADIWIYHGSTTYNSFSYSVKDCFFNRLVNNYAPYCIYLNLVANSNASVAITDNQFQTAGYTPSATRPFVKFNDGGGGLANLILNAGHNGWASSTETPDFALKTAFYGGMGQQPGALINPTASQLIPNATNTPVTLASAAYNNFSIWSNSNPTRLTVPANVTKVRLTGGILYASGATALTYFELNILKNGSASYPGKATSSTTVDTNSTQQAMNVSSPELTVTPGDYFELVAYQSNGSSFNTNGNFGATYFAMEILG